MMLVPRAALVQECNAGAPLRVWGAIADTEVCAHRLCVCAHMWQVACLSALQRSVCAHALCITLRQLLVPAARQNLRALKGIQHPVLEQLVPSIACMLL